MPIPETIVGREFDKFEDVGGETAVRVTDANTDELEGKLESIKLGTNQLGSYQFAHSFIVGTVEYYIFTIQTGKYLIKRLTHVSATEDEMKYANISNNSGIATLADAITNYATMTYSDFSAITL